jgi:hypothetical protein
VTADDGYAVELTPLSQIPAKPVCWLWDQVIPLGALTIAAGREGTGKSQSAAWLAAQVTRGALRGERWGQPRPVIVAATEDSFAHVIVPRMIAVDADTRLVYRMRIRDLSLNSATTLSLPADNDKLKKAITQMQAGLVVLDPLLSVIGSRLDTHKNREVRQALDPLADMADETMCAFYGLMHFSKAEGRDVATLINASGAFKDSARAILAFAMDSAATGIMSQVKNTNGRIPEVSEAYRIDTQHMQLDGKWCQIPRLIFTGPTPRHVENLLDRGSARATAEARDFLLGFLAYGARPANEVIEHAEQGCDISRRTLMRAKKDLGISSYKEEGKWMWQHRWAGSPPK